MYELKDGYLVINTNIILHFSDTLTDFLGKLENIPKNIKNINNYQHVFIRDISIYELHGNITFIFSPCGKLEIISFGIVGEYEYSKKSEIKLAQFLQKHLHTKNAEFEWGKIGLYRDIHNNLVSIVINLV